jgi:hypothetical protein
MEPAVPSDMDGRVEGRVSGSERVKRPTNLQRRPLQQLSNLHGVQCGALEQLIARHPK